MSFRQNVSDGAAFSAAWILGLVLVVVSVLVGLLVWAGVTPWATNKQREINHNSQQYQDAQIQEARNLLDGIVISGDQDQKDLLIRRFCATTENINDVPDDLAAGNTKFC